MKISTVVNPLRFEPNGLLSIIETTSDTFTEGRRNNDLVNWFIAKRLADIAAGEPPSRSHRQKVEDYVHDFTGLMSRMTADQTLALTCWAERWSWKIEVLCRHYDTYDVPALANLWLPMDYVTDSQIEGQTELL